MSKINNKSFAPRREAFAAGVEYAREYLAGHNYRYNSLVPQIELANQVVDTDVRFTWLDSDQKAAFIGFFVDGYESVVAKWRLEEKRRAPAGKPITGKFRRKAAYV